jgi:hypothetical protein
VADRGWKRRFDDPIPLPRGRQLVTLEDAGNYITKLPKVEHDAPEWQAATEALILVAESGGPTMFARIGIMRALNRTLSACLIRIGRTTTGVAGSWRGIGETARRQCLVVLFSSRDDFAYVRFFAAHCIGTASPPRTGNLTFSSQARSGWFSHTHPLPKQIGQSFIHPALAAQLLANGCGGVSNLIDRLSSRSASRQRTTAR